MTLGADDETASTDTRNSAAIAETPQPGRLRLSN